MSQQIRRDFLLPGLLVLVGLVHGLLYVFLVPPWQHYDEPGHFEYVWQIVNRPTWPQEGDYDPAMRRDMLRSMQEYGFYRDLHMTPDLSAAVPDIGLSQVGKKPVYYWLASLPLRFLHDKSLTLQLYASRLVSLILYLLTILIAWGMMRELLPPDHALRWMVPGTLALLPGFTDLMTSVNNDVGAVFLFSLVLWGSVRMFFGGLTLLNLLWVSVAVGLCFLTKNTVNIALPLSLIAVLFGLLHGRWRRVAWGLLGASILLGLFASLSWGDALFWYRQTAQSVSTQTVNSRSPVGSSALRLDVSAPGEALIQIIPPTVVAERLAGKRVTWGAWMWSTQPVRARLPSLSVSTHWGSPDPPISQEVDVDSSPRFYAMSTNLPGNVWQAWLTLSPLVVERPDTLTFYYDGLVLAEGDYPVAEAPRFADSTGEQGIWGSQQFVNEIRNPLAQQSSLGIQSWFLNFASNYFPYLTSSILTSFLDWDSTGWYYRTTAQVLFWTFWSKFGWGNVPLLGDHPYRPLILVAGLGLAGAAWALVRQWRTCRWDVFMFLGLTMTVVWGLAITRGIPSLFGYGYIPVARYSFTAIIPTVLVLNFGWLEFRLQGRRWLRFSPIVEAGLYLLLWVALDVFALTSLVAYYQSP